MRRGVCNPHRLKPGLACKRRRLYGRIVCSIWFIMLLASMRIRIRTRKSLSRSVYPYTESYVLCCVQITKSYVYVSEYRKSPGICCKKNCDPWRQHRSHESMYIKLHDVIRKITRIRKRLRIVYGCMQAQALSGESNHSVFAQQWAGLFKNLNHKRNYKTILFICFFSFNHKIKTIIGLLALQLYIISLYGYTVNLIKKFCKRIFILSW